MVNYTTPVLSNADNFDTFPAVTVMFWLPEGETDPWTYFDTLYETNFISNGNLNP